MRKKLQVFISSTFNDLIEERQAAVQAILRAGHIPAGMELIFKYNKTELTKKWIQESDIFILILGGYYGPLLPDESLSYTHSEYDYAGELGKPRFAFVLTDEALRQKPYDFVVMENYPELQAFKQSVMEQVPIFHVESEPHIHMVIRDLLPEYARRDDLSGWVSGKEIPDVQRLSEENAELLKENARLQAELEKIKKEHQ
ncbi:DUF4062 domain-containing protein [Paenibacillus sp. GCM10012306]|uniref:DUF4062 domain-containing protein n=1 Tax=Paenibacillus sp. GCM10012306 TaxID=3317342 RepID=UPI0036210F0A